MQTVDMIKHFAGAICIHTDLYFVRVYFFAQSLVDYIRSLGTFLCLMSILIFYLHSSPWRDYLTIFSWDQPIDLIKPKSAETALDYHIYSIYWSIIAVLLSTCTVLKSVDSKERVCDCVYCNLLRNYFMGFLLLNGENLFTLCLKKDSL